MRWGGRHRLGCNSGRHRVRDKPSRTAHGSSVPVDKRVHGITEVAQQMPSIRDLDRSRSTLPDPVRVGAGAITRDNFDARMAAQPGRECFSLAIAQQIDHGVALQVDQHRAVAVPPTPGPVIHTEHARGW